MNGRWIAAALLVAATGCGGGDDGRDLEVGVGDDTVRVEVPEDAAERMERTGRRIGGRVGEVLEETGRAIEETGRRIQEEAADTLGS